MIRIVPGMSKRQQKGISLSLCTTVWHLDQKSWAMRNLRISIFLALLMPVRLAPAELRS